MVLKYFIYVNSPLSPHFVHYEWAKSIGCEPLKIPINPFLQFKYLKNFEKIIKKDYYNSNDKEILVIVESLYALPFIYKLKKLYKGKLKIISIIADTSFYPPKLSAIRKIYFKIFRLKEFIDYYIVVSNTIRDWMIKRSNINESKIYVVRPFSLLDIKKREIVKKERNNTITFIGNYTKIKAAERVLKLALMLRDFNFYIIGSVCRVINKKRKSNNVYCTYNISWNELKSILLKSIIYLHPFEFDPFPVAVIDAMRCGNYPLVYFYVGASEILHEQNILKTLETEKWLNRIIDIKDSISKKDFLKYYKLSLEYTKEKSIKKFKNTINKII
ncbi:MAG: glycosyltransferase [Candidatus Aenigmatarchaeota archaeon]